MLLWSFQIKVSAEFSTIHPACPVSSERNISILQIITKPNTNNINTHVKPSFEHTVIKTQAVQRSVSHQSVNKTRMRRCEYHTRYGDSLYQNVMLWWSVIKSTVLVFSQRLRCVILAVDVAQQSVARERVSAAEIKWRSRHSICRKWERRAVRVETSSALAFDKTNYATASFQCLKTGRGFIIVHLIIQPNRFSRANKMCVRDMGMEMKWYSHSSRMNGIMFYTCVWFGCYLFL